MNSLWRPRRLLPAGCSAHTGRHPALARGQSDISERSGQAGPESQLRSAPIHNATDHPELNLRQKSLTPGQPSIFGGELVQDGNATNLIFSPAETAAYASGWLTHEPGDVIATGPPRRRRLHTQAIRFLHPGGQVTVQIDGIGRLTNPIAERERRTGRERI
jgi:hypothetical protein